MYVSGVTEGVQGCVHGGYMEGVTHRGVYNRKERRISKKETFLAQSWTKESETVGLFMHQKSVLFLKTRKLSSIKPSLKPLENYV